MRRFLLWCVLPLTVLPSSGCSSRPGVYDKADSSSDTAKTGDSDGTADSVPDVTDALYARDHVLEVAIDLEPADWEALAHQHRNLLDVMTGDCLAGPWASPYTWFTSTVTIDGQVVENTGVRKKGLIGSDSSTKPSLKLSFDEFDDGRNFHGVDELTLNNAQQDPSFIHQCMGYDLFRAADAPASRCGFAHVVVNGDDLGVYANVEPVDKDLLRRWYDDPDGNLYEGRLSDFREGWTDTFEKKTNEDDPDRGDLARLTEALEADDDVLLDEVGPYVDLDAFYTYWAMETLIGHWDSYSANVNNFYVYDDPDTGRFHFLPWGIDSVLDNEDPFRTICPKSVCAVGTLARRLYLLPDSQAEYVDHLRSLLGTVWDEDALLTQVDELSALIDPYVKRSERNAFNTAIATTRDVIEGRRAVLEADLADGPPTWEQDPRGNPCLSDVGTLSGTFSVELGDWDFESGGESTLSFVYLDADYPVTDTNVVAATDGEGMVYLGVEGSLSWGASILAYFMFDASLLAPGSLPIDWSTVTSYLYYKDTTTDWSLAAYLWQGSLELSEASDENGATIAGSFSTTIWGATK